MRKTTHLMTFAHVILQSTALKRHIISLLLLLPLAVHAQALHISCDRVSVYMYKDDINQLADKPSSVDDDYTMFEIADKNTLVTVTMSGGEKFIYYVNDRAIKGDYWTLFCVSPQGTNVKIVVDKGANAVYFAADGDHKVGLYRILKTW